MRGILSHPLQRILEDVDAIADGKIQIEFVGVLEKADGQRQQFRRGERQMVAEDRQFIVPLGKAQMQRRLEPGHDIVRHFIRRGNFIHRDAGTKIFRGLDLNPRHDGFHEPPVIEQRGQGRPGLFIHTIAFIEHADASAQHRTHQR